MRKAKVRTRSDSWHPIILLVSFSVIGLSIWGYWRLAQDVLHPPPAVMPGAKPEPTAQLKAARVDFRRAYLDPLAHIRLAEALYKEGRLVDSFLVLDGARGFFGEGRFAFAHDEVILEGDPQLSAPTPTGPAWATQQAIDFERQARALAERADFREALKTVDEGLAVSPQEPSLTALKALLLSRFLERPAEALPLYRGLALFDPAAPAGRLGVDFLGKRAHFAAIQRGPDGARSGDPSGTQAIETLEELARNHPDDPRIFQTLGMLRWTEGKLDAVRELVKTTLARNPKHAGALSLAGALALNDKDADGAIRQLEAALKVEPADMYSALKLAELRQRYRADRRAALPLWIAVHRLDPWRESQGRGVAEIVRESLAEFSSDAVKDAGPGSLAELLDSDDGAIRAEAAAAAGRALEARLVEPLGVLLDDDVELARKSADEALFSIGKSSPTPAFHDAVFGWVESDKALTRSRALNLASDLYRDEAKAS
ncbi:MAG: hypothetical protein HY925_03875, partial [Elusimicrobia bacterium]|nr:hypothetical protein [Elusimicrobiota bacterium]